MTAGRSYGYDKHRWGAVKESKKEKERKRAHVLNNASV